MCGGKRNVVVVLRKLNDEVTNSQPTTNPIKD
jgi:hypothetical protein